MIINACQKEELSKTNDALEAPEIFFKENRVAFNTIENYENLVTNISEKKISLLQDVNQNPLSTFKKSLNRSEELYDDFLLSILNEDKIVQIGQWVIKVDMESGLVSALSEDDIIFYDDLVNDAINDKIYRFTTGDDVLDLLDAGVKGTINTSQFKKLWCKDARAKMRRKTQTDGGKLSGEQKLVLQYFKSGIYFTLYAKVKNKRVYSGSQDARVTMYLEYEFDDRCGRSYSRGQTTITKTGRLPMGNVVQNIYRHVRNLEKYRLDVDYKVAFYNFYGDYIGTVSYNKLSIKSNMTNWY